MTLTSTPHLANAGVHHASANQVSSGTITSVTADVPNKVMYAKALSTGTKKNATASVIQL